MMYPAVMAEAITRLVLRMPADLHAAIRKWARDDERSLNAQIIYLLRRALEDRSK